MSDTIFVFSRFIGHTVEAWFCAVLPVWVILLFMDSASHTIAITLILALVFAFIQICRSVNPLTMGIDEYRQRLGDKKSAGIFCTVGVLGVVAVVTYSGYSTYQREFEETALRVAELANEELPVYVPPEPNCQDLGVKYGRASVRGMHNQYVNPADDFVMPARCRNLPSTQAGIRAGIENELLR